ncbi:MAG: isoprenylcysteine carboxylmethyltransferase family protein [bacterium]|nr:isoprenylcysteine carboxylmethyltransferase family protein [bacterium]
MQALIANQLTLLIHTDWKDVTVAATFTVIYGLRLLYQGYLLRHRDKSAKPGDWGEILLVVVPKNILFALAIYFLLLGVPQNWIFIVGWTFFLLGITIRMVALYQLGSMYSLNVEIRAEHKLVTEGIYVLIRHPLYLAYILDTVGIVLFLQRWYLSPVVLCVLIGWVVRIRNEETSLRHAFGPAYDTYAEKVPSLNMVTGIYRKTRDNLQYVMHPDQPTQRRMGTTGGLSGEKTGK